MKTVYAKDGYPIGKTLTVAELREIIDAYPDDLPVFATWEGVDIMLSSERITRGITHPSIDSVILDVNEDVRLYHSP